MSTPKVPITTSLAAWAHNLPAGFNVLVHNEWHTQVYREVMGALSKEYWLHSPSVYMINHAYRFHRESCICSGDPKSPRTVLMFTDIYNLSDLQVEKGETLQDNITNHLAESYYAVVLVTSNPVVVRNMTNANLYRLCQGVGYSVFTVTPLEKKIWTKLSLDDIYENYINAGDVPVNSPSPLGGSIGFYLDINGRRLSMPITRDTKPNRWWFHLEIDGIVTPSSGMFVLWEYPSSQEAYTAGIQAVKKYWSMLEPALSNQDGTPNTWDSLKHE